MYFLRVHKPTKMKKKTHNNFYEKIIIFTLSNFDAGTRFGMSIDMVAQVVGMAMVLGLSMSS
jgi:hypothetical protein